MGKSEGVRTRIAQLNPRSLVLDLTHSLRPLDPYRTSHHKMPTTISSLPPETVLDILEFLDIPSPLDTDSAAAPGTSPTPNPLLATALVDRRFRQLSQEIMFRSVTLHSREQARRWRATGAGAYTREARVRWYDYGGSLKLAELFAPSEAHGEAESEAKIRKLVVERCSMSELGDKLEGDGMLRGEWRVSRAGTGGAVYLAGG